MCILFIGNNGGGGFYNSNGGGSYGNNGYGNNGGGSSYGNNGGGSYGNNGGGNSRFHNSAVNSETEDNWGDMKALNQLAFIQDPILVNQPPEDYAQENLPMRYRLFYVIKYFSFPFQNQHKAPNYSIFWPE